MFGDDPQIAIMFEIVLVPMGTLVIAFGVWCIIQAFKRKLS